MSVGRREFLKLLGVSAGAAGLGGCGRDWSVPDQLVELALRGPGLESDVQTVCGLCESGCGMTVRLVDGLPVGLKGNPRHPLNRGGLCPVGHSSLEVLFAEGRLREPLRRRQNGSYESTSWEDALKEISGVMTEVVSSGRGQSVAMLIDEPGRLIWDLAERFVHALGSQNIARPRDSSVTAYQLMQGLDRVPAYDLAGTDLVASFGLDIFEDGPAPLHAIAALIGSRSTDERARLIHIGTRLSPSATKADQFVPVKAGTHAAFALGVAHVLVREGVYDRSFVSERTFGFDDWNDESGRRRKGFRRLLMENYYPDRAASLAGCEATEILQVARRLAGAERPLAVVGGEATLGSNSTSTQMAVQALNALLGAFDRAGGIVLPPTIPLTPLEPLIASSTPQDGFSIDPIDTLIEAVEDENKGIDILFLVGSNPLFESPAGEQLRDVMDRIPVKVALTPFRDETASVADFVLPTPTFLESWQGLTTPTSVAFATLSVSRPVLEPIYDCRHAGDTLLALASSVGGKVGTDLPWQDYVSYLKHRLQGLVISGEGSVVSGSFEESWVHYLEQRGWRFLDHSGLEPFWRDLVREGAWWNPVRQEGDWDRIFSTPSGRFEFYSQSLETRLQKIGRSVADNELSDAEALQRGIDETGLTVSGDDACLPHFEPPGLLGDGELALVPFSPITSRGSLAVSSPMLLEMFGYQNLSGWETWLELSSETAHRLHLGDGDRVAVESSRGTIEAIIRVAPGAADDVAHMPLGLGHREGFGTADGIGSNPLEIVADSRDSLSGHRASASSRVNLRLLERRQRGGPAPIHGGHS